MSTQLQEAVETIISDGGSVAHMRTRIRQIIAEYSGGAVLIGIEISNGAVIVCISINSLESKIMVSLPLAVDRAVAA